MSRSSRRHSPAHRLNRRYGAWIRSQEALRAKVTRLAPEGQAAGYERLAAVLEGRQARVSCRDGLYWVQLDWSGERGYGGGLEPAPECLGANDDYAVQRLKDLLAERQRLWEQGWREQDYIDTQRYYADRDDRYDPYDLWLDQYAEEQEWAIWWQERHHKDTASS